MPASTRVLVVDSDATSQGEIQKLLVSRRFVALGGAELGEETVAMARAFQPQVVLLNLDNGRESYSAAELVASELPETRVIAYSRRRDLESVSVSSGAGLNGSVKVVPADETSLLAAIEAALTEPLPIAVDDGNREIVPLSPVASPNWEGWPYGRPPRRNAEPFLRHFAQMACEWLVTRSPRAEEALVKALAEDVLAPSFGGRGRKVVLRGLEAIAWRLGGDLRLVPGEAEGELVLVVVVPESDNNWRPAGHFIVRTADESTVSYLEYREDEASG